jgi:hypothetical protein
MSSGLVRLTLPHTPRYGNWESDFVQFVSIPTRDGMLVAVLAASILDTTDGVGREFRIRLHGVGSSKSTIRRVHATRAKIRYMLRKSNTNIHGVRKRDE